MVTILAVNTSEMAISQPFTFRYGYEPDESALMDPIIGSSSSPLSKKDEKKIKTQIEMRRHTQPHFQRPELAPATLNLCFYAKVCVGREV